jgi:FtsP/CotA-like multicopper oxidase with cupredoxin domain
MRAVFGAIALVILVAAFVVLRPSGDDPERPAAAPTATPTPTATATSAGSTPAPTETPTPAPTVDPGPLLTGAKVVKIRVQKGDTVRFRVRSPKAEEVHVHGYDLMKDLSPGKTATMSFKATIDGIFEIEFEHSATQIAQLRVDPR